MQIFHRIAPGEQSSSVDIVDCRLELLPVSPLGTCPLYTATERDTPEWRRGGDKTSCQYIVMSIFLRVRRQEGRMHLFFSTDSAYLPCTRRHLGTPLPAARTWSRLLCSLACGSSSSLAETMPLCCEGSSVQS